MILLQVSGLAKSVYYYTLSKIDKDDKNKEIIDKIKEIFINNKERYGYRRITLELRNQGYNVNHKKVYRIMVKLGLKPLKRNKRKYSSYKGTVGKIADNFIERNFNAEKPNQKWYTDITEFNLRGEKCYLSPILDGYNGEIISYNTSKSPNLEQINDMLNKAFDGKNLEGLIFHSDQGWQYQHQSYQKRLKNKGIKQSMSRKGNSMDNGMMENFFGHELMNICVEVSKTMNSNINQLSDNESMFYINYAGGDDLVIMGPASGILELSKVIKERFSEYTLNKNITISGGITIQSPSAPIRFGIKEAEEYLNQSKILDGKNGITLIHTSCKMNEYEQVLEQVNVFRKYITNQDISRSNFYNMMKVLDVENMEKYYRNIPILLYSLKRNVKNKDVRQDLISKISMVNMNCDQLKKLVLEMKLAIMQTRG